ncbi:SgcJ/EcaC family oxidoreductase [Phytoactinopolyspora mesophila]|uniref:SgcJ/EcaC family oxidoreductase n=1 Tax=Phytoactinopolyspora mesophila TaxID=2650750 RepID=A0A7K3LYE1_9ACTN|nr:SgcJ/EcaC family oxidoreductase [Phytoactinopolyspora mesophila]NDL56045.1 SgcJ/EcaC family oxidoreductase [Phytoactinopolyspora mesophila]
MAIDQQNHHHGAIEKVVADAEKLQFDVDGFTNLLADDVVLINFFGRRLHGKDQVYAAMAQALQTPLTDVRTKHELVDVIFPRPDVAIASIVKHVYDERAASPESGAALQNKGAMTMVLVKSNGDWLITLAQTTPIKD